MSFLFEKFIKVFTPGVSPIENISLDIRLHSLTGSQKKDENDKNFSGKNIVYKKDKTSQLINEANGGRNRGIGLNPECQ